MRLECCIAFGENGDRPQRPRLPHGFNRAGIEVLLIREAHHDIGKGEAEAPMLVIGERTIRVEFITIARQEERDIDQPAIVSDLLVQLPEAPLPATPRSRRCAPRDRLARSLSIKVLSTSKRKVTRRLGHISLMPSFGGSAQSGDHTGTRMFLSTPPESEDSIASWNEVNGRLGYERFDIEPAVGDRGDGLRVAVWPGGYRGYSALWYRR